ncbi:MAG TPA: sensor histidine kinase [Acidimicrobiales bacterium]|nr:sensor histidine kinase [Acidimicrobiales bacterium]
MTQRALPAVGSPMAAAVATGVTLTVLAVATPFLRLAYDNPSLHVALETAEGLIGALVAYLAAQRFRVSGSRRELVLAWTFSLLAVTNLALSAVPLVTSGARPGGDLPWIVMGLRLSGAAGLLVAAWADPAATTTWERARRPLAGVTAGVVVAVTVGAAAAGAWLAEAVELPLDAGATGRPRLVGHPVVLAVQIVAMALFAAAALRFAGRSGGDDGLVRWLAAGCALAAFARLDYALYPSLYTSWVYTGDVLRFGSYLCFLAGAALEIDAYRRGQTRLAVLEERRRIARDLHDGLVQDLSFIRSQTAAMAEGAEIPEMAAHVAAAADRAVQESRRALDALTGVAPGPLVDTLRVAATEVADRTGAAVRVTAEGMVPPLAADVVRELSLVVREATSNAVGHGKASTVHLRVLLKAGRLRLVVADDGTGFDTAARGSGFGLRSMRERAEALGGRFAVRSEPGSGTEVEVSIPLR